MASLLQSNPGFWRRGLGQILVKVTVRWQHVGVMLAAVRARLAHFEPVLVKAKAILARTIADNFAMQGRPRWAPRKDQAPHPLLVKTGKLRSAATSLQLMRTSTGVLYFANVGQAGVAHKHGVHGTFMRGGHPVRMNLPARDFMTVTTSAARQIADMLGRYVVGG